MGNSARNAHSDMLEIVELESWPVEFLQKLKRSTKCRKFLYVRNEFDVILYFHYGIIHNFIIYFQQQLVKVVYKKAYDVCRVAGAFKKFVNKKQKLKIKYDADAKIKTN